MNKRTALSLFMFAALLALAGGSIFSGPGGPQAIFALESHMDILAGKLGMDPLDLRLNNIVQDGDEVVAPGIGVTLEDGLNALQVGHSGAP